MTRAPLALAALALSLSAAAFDLQGHRGARGLAPENTLPAFAMALSIGVGTLELDTGVTKDGIVVVHHDSALNPDITRGPDGQWLTSVGPLLRDLTHESLSRYDVGRAKPETNHARRHPQQVPADGTRIPRLADVFDLVRRAGNAEVRFNIETKLSPMVPDHALPPEEFARKLIAEVREAGVEARTTIQSFDWRALRAVQGQAPGIPTAYLTARQRFLDNVCTGTGATKRDIAPADCPPSAWTAGFHLKDHGSVPKMVKAAGGAIWSPFFGDLDAASLREARDLGLKVVVWTVNDPADIDRMMEMGVDGIISDRPDLVREAMAKRGMALPKPTPVTP